MTVTPERRICLRVFVAKHPCDDQPYIHDVDPDPRSDDFRERFGANGEDYSGWYVRERLRAEAEPIWWCDTHNAEGIENHGGTSDECWRIVWATEEPEAVPYPYDLCSMSLRPLGPPMSDPATKEKHE